MPRFAFGPPAHMFTDAQIENDPELGRDWTRSMLRDGENVGHMSYSLHQGELHVHYIESSLFSRADAPGSLGTTAMRELTTQLRGEGVKTISGNRITGARYPSAKQDPNKAGFIGPHNLVKISLDKRGEASAAKERVRIGHGDQPRDERGRFASTG